MLSTRLRDEQNPSHWFRDTCKSPFFISVDRRGRPVPPGLYVLRDGGHLGTNSYSHHRIRGTRRPGRAEHSAYRRAERSVHAFPSRARICATICRCWCFFLTWMSFL